MTTNNNIVKSQGKSDLFQVGLFSFLCVGIAVAIWFGYQNWTKEMVVTIDPDKKANAQAYYDDKFRKLGDAEKEQIKKLARPELINVAQNIGYEGCSLMKDVAPGLIESCQMKYTSEYFALLTDTKGMIEKDTCQAMETRFGKMDQATRRCWFIYGTTVGQMAKNTSYCNHLPTRAEAGVKEHDLTINATPGFFPSNSRSTREDCAYLIQYSSLTAEEFQGTYFDTIERQGGGGNSILYNQFLNKNADMNYAKQDYDLRFYPFQIDEVLFGRKKEFEEAKKVVDEGRKTFLK